MSKKKKILPELRFPEFANNETWADRKLSDVLFEHKEKSTGDEEVYSVSVHKGVVNQIEHLGRVFAASNTENYKRVLPGDIIYTKSPTGDFPFGIIKQSKVSKPVIVSPLYGVFKPETTDLGIILDAYFEYPERTINYLSSIVQKGAKNTINIHNDTFLSKSLILPLDKKEQSKIASCLSSLDELIVAHNQKLDLLKDHKKGLVQNLFPQEGEKAPKFRFNEFRKEGEWKKTTIDEIAKVSTGGTPESTNPEYWNGNIPWMNSGELNNKRIYSVSNFITEKGLKESSTKLIPPFCILIGLAGQGKTRGTAAINYIELCTNQSIGSIHPNEDVFDSEFLYQRIDSMYNKLRYLSSGDGGRGGLNLQIIKEFELSLPNLKEQKKIASCLYSLDEIITEQAELIEQLKQHKKGLMQRLFPKTID